jgi:hypothetical protein
MRSRLAVLLALFVAGCEADPCSTALELTPVDGRISARRRPRLDPRHRARRTHLHGRADVDRQ